jgi:hypothetical protein
MLIYTHHLLILFEEPSKPAEAVTILSCVWECLVRISTGTCIILTFFSGFNRHCHANVGINSKSIENKLERMTDIGMKETIVHLCCKSVTKFFLWGVVIDPVIF